MAKNASLINAAHRAIISANKTQMEKAIEAGTILKACKDSVGHGGWSKWLHRDISEETARLYMRLAAPGNARKLEAEAAQNGNTVPDLSIRSTSSSRTNRRTKSSKEGSRRPDKDGMESQDGGGCPNPKETKSNEGRRCSCPAN